MKTLSKEFRRALYNNERNYLAYADITLSDGTELNLTNSEIWTGGFTYEEAVSDDESFTALGSAIIGSATLIINNIYETYSPYDFTNAIVELSIGMQFTDRLEKFKVGTYTVDETNYNGATIRLSLLDNMEQFDRPYSISTLVYPATLELIVRDACTNCGVTLLTQDFPHKAYEIPTRPTDEDITFREVISWCAAIAGCFAKCDPNGRLELKWFNQSAFDQLDELLDGGTLNPWTAGELKDGGTFSPWTTGDEIDGGTLSQGSDIHHLISLYSQDISMDDIVITGISASVKNEDDDTQDIIQYTAGTSGYVVELAENPFITPTNAQTILNWLGTQLIGLQFRKFNISQASDPSIESGDVAIVIDRKQNVYRGLVTRMSFSVDGSQTVVSGASTPSRNSATRFSSATKSYVEARKLLKKQKTTYDQALDDLAAALDEKSGLYSTIETTQSGNIFYLHDAPLLSDSKVVWKMTSEAWGVTTNYQGAQTVWNSGLTVDGAFLASVINTIGLFFDYAHGGTLILGGDNNVNGLLKIVDASNNEIGRWGKDGISILKGSLNIGNGAFQVGTNGKLTATGGDFSGKITSTDGSIGGITIKSNYLYSNTTSWINNTTNLGDRTPYNRTGDVYMGKGGLSVGTSSYQTLMTNLYIRYNGYYLPRAYVGLGNTPNQDGIRYGIWAYRDYASQSPDLEFSNTIVNSLLNVFFRNNVTVTGSFSVSGTKNRLKHTESYGDRLLYAYETASPMFGDVGEGHIADDGLCYITIDPILAQTISTTQYQVFLQKYGQGDCWIKERHSDYFIVEGTPGLNFGWELKGKQEDYDQVRLGVYGLYDRQDTYQDYGKLAVDHINELKELREV